MSENKVELITIAKELVEKFSIFRQSSAGIYNPK